MRRWSRDELWTTAGVLAFCGALSLGFGLYARDDAVELERDGGHATAVIVATTVTTTPGSGGGPDADQPPLPPTTAVHYTVRFTPTGARPVVARTFCDGVGKPRHEKGARVAVRYDVERPSRVCLTEDLRRASSFSTVLLWAGGIALVAAMVAALLGLRGIRGS